MMSHELAQQLLRLPVWDDSDDPIRSWRLNLSRCPTGQECIR